MNLIYINNGKSSVFDSQVLALLNYYQKESFFENIILLFGYRSQSDIDWVNKKHTKQLKIVFYKSYPNYPIFNKLIQKKLLKAIHSVSSEFSNFFFHIRGEMTSYHFRKISRKLNIKDNQLLTDVRRVNIEQIKEYGHNNWVRKVFKLWNCFKFYNDLKKHYAISVVSIALKNHLISSLNIKENFISVNHCLVDENFCFSPEEREKLRSALSIKRNEVLLVFASGGTAPWQNNNMLLTLAEKGFRVLNLSRIEIDHKNIINRFVSYSKMPSYLSAADVSFIWRDESLVNKVSSPVKFSEYLSCGLPVIHNGTIDLINNVTISNNAGLRIDNLDSLNLCNVKKLIDSIDRVKLSEKGKLLFGVPIVAHKYLNMYSNVFPKLKELNN